MYSISIIETCIMQYNTTIIILFFVSFYYVIFTCNLYSTTMHRVLIKIWKVCSDNWKIDISVHIFRRVFQHPCSSTRRRQETTSPSPLTPTTSLEMMCKSIGIKFDSVIQSYFPLIAVWKYVNKKWCKMKVKPKHFALDFIFIKI